MTQKAPKSFEDAFQEANLDPEDHAALKDAKDPQDPDAGPPRIIPGAPAWARFPEDLALPEKEISFMLFKAKWTDYPSKGDHHCILWTLSDNDEKHAAKRARGDQTRGLVELAKGTIRAYDGVRVNWGNGPDVLNTFWNDIGAKCRQMVMTYYFKTHALSVEEQADFFSSCFESKRMVAG